VDHFLGGEMLMGDKAGDGFGGMLDGAHRGAVAGHVSATQDHFAHMVLDKDAEGGGNDLMSVGGIMQSRGIGKGAADMANAGSGKTGDHFTGGTMGMAFGGEALVDVSGNALSSVQHHDGEKQASFDHFSGGTMGLLRGGGTELLSAGGTLLSSKHVCSDHSKNEDHFTMGEMQLDESADSGMLSADGHMMSHKHHEDGAENKDSMDHFAGGGMTMAGSGIEGEEGSCLISADGSVMASLSHAGKHGVSEHSYDHFSGMNMGSAASDVALMGVQGGMSKGVARVEGQAMTTDHFNDGGMALGQTANAQLTDARGNILVRGGHDKSSKHHTKTEDHFGMSGFDVGANTKMYTKEENQIINKNKHFTSFYT